MMKVSIRLCALVLALALLALPLGGVAEGERIVLPHMMEALGIPLWRAGYFESSIDPAQRQYYEQYAPIDPAQIDFWRSLMEDSWFEVVEELQEEGVMGLSFKGLDAGMGDLTVSFYAGEEDTILLYDPVTPDFFFTADGRRGQAGLRVDTALANVPSEPSGWALQAELDQYGHTVLPSFQAASHRIWPVEVKTENGQYSEFFTQITVYTVDRHLRDLVLLCDIEPTLLREEGAVLVFSYEAGDMVCTLEYDASAETVLCTYPADKVFRLLDYDEVLALQYHRAQDSFAEARAGSRYVFPDFGGLSLVTPLPEQSGLVENSLYEGAAHWVDGYTDVTQEHLANYARAMQSYGFDCEYARTDNGMNSYSFFLDEVEIHLWHHNDDAMVHYSPGTLFYLLTGVELFKEYRN